MFLPDFWLPGAGFWWVVHAVPAVLCFIDKDVYKKW
jgi:hypothetical protein